MKLFGWIVPLLGANRIGAYATALASLLIFPAAAMAEGMPQLDFKTPLTVSQVVWGVIIFVALYIMLSRAGLPLVASVLDERAAHIGGDLEGARSAKASADAGITEAQTAIAQARTQAQTAINAALDEAKKTAAVQSEALNASLEARLQEAEAQIAQARTSAMGALRQVAMETTASVVSRLTGIEPSFANLEAAVAAALSARGIGQGSGMQEHS